MTKPEYQIPPGNRNGNGNAKPTPSSGHFARERAFVEGGWFHRLTCIQISVYFAYHLHADDDGITWIGTGKIAKILGHKTSSNVFRVRKELVDLKLIQIREDGGPRKSAVVKVLTPPIKAIGVKGAPVRKAHQCATDTRASAQLTPVLVRNSHLDHLIEHTNEHSSSSNAESAAAVADGNGEKTGGEEPTRTAAERDALIVFLADAEVGEPTLSRLVDEIPDLTLAIAKEIKAGMSGRAGVGAFIQAIGKNWKSIREKLAAESTVSPNDEPASICTNRPLIAQALADAETYIADPDRKQKLESAVGEILRVGGDELLNRCATDRLRKLSKPDDQIHPTDPPLAVQWLAVFQWNELAKSRGKAMSAA